MILILISPNISRTKGNHTMKFGQLIENNISNIFNDKSYTKCDGEASSRHFSKESKLIISLFQQSELLHSLLYTYIVCPSRGIKYTKTKVY